MTTRNNRPACDWREDCENPVTHIGAKGYVYCAEHAPNRQGWESVRKMRAWEVRVIESGQPLRSYRPISKAEHDAIAQVNA